MRARRVGDRSSEAARLRKLYTDEVIERAQKQGIEITGSPHQPDKQLWAVGLLGRMPFKQAAVALANKMARIIWAMMMKGEAFRTAEA